MGLTYKPLDTIAEADIQQLVVDSVPEGRQLEYKRALPGGADEDKREFLADTSSFANSLGGDIVYGVEESAGVPIAVPGVRTNDADGEILRLETVIRSGVEPRIIGIRIRGIALTNGNIAIVVRIPKSWIVPHMVTFKNLSRFYARNSAGKYQLDVTELRSLFSFGAGLEEQVRRFRAERLSAIVSGAAPFQMREGAKVVLHLVPLGAFTLSAPLDLSNIGRHTDKMEPLYRRSTVVADTRV
jgi:hypothetical protein